VYPVLFIDDEFYGCQAFLSAFVIAVTYADELVIILPGVVLASILPRLYCGFYFHVNSPCVFSNYIALTVYNKPFQTVRRSVPSEQLGGNKKQQQAHAAEQGNFR
jgi:hypothetical protein